MTPKITPTGLAKRLAEAEESETPVCIGLIGCGEMGTDIVTRSLMMPGVRLGAIADHSPKRCLDAIRLADTNAEIGSIANTAGAIDTSIENGRIAVTESSDQILESGRIDVIIDATGSPSAGAELGLAAINHGKHLVMMNVEADVTIGRSLKQAADRQGVIYSLGAGDEPSSCMELIEFVAAMGHTVVAAGKGKNNPLNFNAVPADYEEEARQRNMNARVLVEFVDGSKSMVEMAAIANATGLTPDIPGMHRPAIGPDDLATTLIPESDGGVLSGSGRVDFTTGGGLAPGVFVIVAAQHPRILERMRDLKVGPGPYFSFIRPYHLTSLEVPLTCARVVLTGQADMQPLDHPVAEVCAIAKKSISAGETLDLIGETCYRGWTLTHTDARRQNAVPLGLLARATAARPITAGSLITYDDVTLPDNPLVRLRAAQDSADSSLASPS